MKLIILILFTIFLSFSAASQVYTQFDTDACSKQSVVNIGECTLYETCNVNLKYVYNSLIGNYSLLVYALEDTSCLTLLENASFNCTEKPSDIGAVIVQCQTPVTYVYYQSFSIKTNSECTVDIKLDTCNSSCLGNVKISKDDMVLEGYSYSIYNNSNCENEPKTVENFKCLANNKDIELNGVTLYCGEKETPSPSQNETSSQSHTSSESGSSGFPSAVFSVVLIVTVTLLNLFF
ncbi:hypothetical protein DICPUDRAFT_150483 [Dictyostelium purpureum]|uniref:Transmembrane protein n=1 Tax=Dictyostelium purpureum TaxID=5786 RepID=F0ZGF6_DICPU|nr:uncharacterized protein DICPUDRAFT_150483 [Dictyostelium purpureum]EGC36984.1 hypothetical protein DICPUDRAFT_150483 [Dictyostelium purpureum]|eukprot:XP_003286481.1 hypothetical protein DICPUDRAFT_150483 [Dictyostelium purpureum]